MSDGNNLNKIKEPVIYKRRKLKKRRYNKYFRRKVTKEPAQTRLQTGAVIDPQSTLNISDQSPWRPTWNTSSGPQLSYLSQYLLKIKEPCTMDKDTSQYFECVTPLANRHICWLVLFIILMILCRVRRNFHKKALQTCTAVCVVTIALAILFEIILHWEITHSMPKIKLHPAENGEIVYYIGRIKPHVEKMTSILVYPYQGNQVDMENLTRYIYRYIDKLIVSNDELISSYTNPVETFSIETPLLLTFLSYEWNHFMFFLSYWTASLLVVCSFSSCKYYSYSTFFGAVAMCLAAIAVTYKVLGLVESCNNTHALTMRFANDMNIPSDEMELRKEYNRLCRSWFANFELRLEYYEKMYLYASNDLFNYATGTRTPEIYRLLNDVIARVQHVHSQSLPLLRQTLPPRCNFHFKTTVDPKNWTTLYTITSPTYPVPARADEKLKSEDKTLNLRFNPPRTPKPHYERDTLGPLYMPPSDTILRALCYQNKKLRLLVVQVILIVLAGSFVIMILLFSLVQLKWLLQKGKTQPEFFKYGSPYNEGPAISPLRVYSKQNLEKQHNDKHSLRRIFRMRWPLRQCIFLQQSQIKKHSQQQRPSQPKSRLQYPFQYSWKQFMKSQRLQQQCQLSSPQLTLQQQCPSNKYYQQCASRTRQQYPQRHCTVHCLSQIKVQQPSQEFSQVQCSLDNFLPQRQSIQLQIRSSPRFSKEQYLPQSKIRQQGLKQTQNQYLSKDCLQQNNSAQNQIKECSQQKCSNCIVHQRYPSKESFQHHRSSKRTIKKQNKSTEPWECTSSSQCKSQFKYPSITDLKQQNSSKLKILYQCRSKKRCQQHHYTHSTQKQNLAKDSLIKHQCSSKYEVHNQFPSKESLQWQHSSLHLIPLQYQSKNNLKQQYLSLHKIEWWYSSKENLLRQRSSQHKNRRQYTSKDCLKQQNLSQKKIQRQNSSTKSLPRHRTSKHKIRPQCSSIESLQHRHSSQYIQLHNVSKENLKRERASKRFIHRQQLFNEEEQLPRSISMEIRQQYRKNHYVQSPNHSFSQNYSQIYLRHKHLPQQNESLALSSQETPNSWECSSSYMFGISNISINNRSHYRRYKDTSSCNQPQPHLSQSCQKSAKINKKFQTKCLDDVHDLDQT